MKKTVLLIVAGVLGVAFLAAAAGGWGEAWEREHEGSGEGYEAGEMEGGGFHGFGGRLFRMRADVPPVENARYREECGGCHFPYQPALLPAEDWVRILRSLENHYGEDASLDEATRKALEDYLVRNAADRVDRPRARGFARGGRASGELPRITETWYFRRKHAEIPRRIVMRGEVGSFSRCDACHRRADQGIYNEEDVVIPGVGRWED